MDGITAYISHIHGHSIGDTLNNMSFDVHARKNGIDIYWIIHNKAKGIHQGKITDGFIHWELFRLYYKADIFRKLVHIDWLDDKNYFLDENAAPIVDYINKVYNDPVTERRIYNVVSEGECGPINMAKELRTRFSFLYHRTLFLPYATIQPSSNFYGAIKTASVENIAKHLKECLREYPIVTTVYILGAYCDVIACVGIRTELKSRFPNISFIDVSGRTDILNYFEFLYNSEFHISVESSSGFFTSQVGVHTRYITLPHTQCRQTFEPQYKNIPWILFDTDDGETRE